MAAKIRFTYEDLETFAEGDLDTRGRKGEADVPVHYHTVRVTIRIKTDEENKSLSDSPTWLHAIVLSIVFIALLSPIIM